MLKQSPATEFEWRNVVARVSDEKCTRETSGWIAELDWGDVKTSRQPSITSRQPPMT